MRQRFLNILALVGFISFAGCAAEDVLPDDPSGDDELITFSAVQEGTATKAEISQSDSKVINWSTGDAITVYDGGGNSVRFGLTEGAGGTRACSRERSLRRLRAIWRCLLIKEEHSLMMARSSL